MSSPAAPLALMVWMPPLDAGAMLRVALALRLAAIAAALLAWRRPAVARATGFLGSAVASLVTAAAAVTVLQSGPDRGRLFVHQASQVSLTYAIDGLSAWFLIVLAALAVPVAIYSLGYIAHPHFQRRSAFAAGVFATLVGAVELVFVADDALTFVFAWEIMTLTAAALVATDHEVREARRAAYLYLVMSHVGIGCVLAAFLVLASGLGSLSFSALLSGAVLSGPMRDVVFALFFVGFGVKAGIVPLHIWLPEAHPAAPTTISAFMSGVLLKTGIYGMVRICAFGLGVPRLSWGVVVLFFGGVSAVLGVLYALMQHDLKRLLAYHSIENIGIIMLGLGTGMMALAYGRSDLAWIGVAAALYHVLNHAVFKGLLFLGAGAVVLTTGTRQIEQFGGLLRRMPWTGLYFLVGAMAISGLPPLNGFASEWLTFQALLYGFRGSAEPLVHFVFPVGGALLALTTALAAACFVKAFGITFLALPRSSAAAAACDARKMMLGPQAFLAFFCVTLGIFPGIVLRVLGRVMAPLPGLQPIANSAWGAVEMTAPVRTFDHVVPAILGGMLVATGLAGAAFAWRRRAAIRVVPTWGCGGELSARTEYTATAFSKPLMMIFRAIYRPTREVASLAEVSPYFPSEVRYRAEIEPTFERFVYGPVVRTILRVAKGMKVLQAGSLHAYLAYTIALVVWLVLLVWWRA